MRISITVNEDELPERFRQLFKIVSKEIWRRRAIDLANRERQNPHLGDYFDERYTVERFLDRALVHWSQRNKFPPVRGPDGGRYYQLYSFLHILSSVYPCLSPRGHLRVQGYLRHGLQSEVGLAAFAHELAVAVHLWSAGFDVEFADIEDRARFDLLAQKEGLRLEVDCKTPSQTVTRQTNVLVVGELGWPLLDDGRPSNKLSRAGSYGVPVVSERRFLEWIGKAVPDSWHRTYSADQIAALSKLSSDTIDELVRFGLLDPRGGLFGFRDLASARQLSSLFANGIGLSEIIRSVKEIRAWLPKADLSNLRLHPAGHHAIEIEQPEGRTDKRGQFVLPVSPPKQNADALFEQAQAAEETGDVAEAKRLYRLLMKCDPTD